MSKNKLAILTLNTPGVTDFASARNAMLKKTKADWVLFLDSDEKLSGPIQDLSDNYNGYTLNRKTYFLGQFVGTDRIVRLGRNNTGEWQRRVHEVWHINGPIGTLQTYIIHNTANNLHDYLAKINIYSKLHAQENFKEGKKSNLIKIIFYPIGKFLATYVTSKNIVFSIMQSFHSFLAWSELWISTRKTGQAKLT